MTTTGSAYLRTLAGHLDPDHLYSAADLVALLVAHSAGDEPRRARILLARHAYRCGFPETGDGPGPAWLGRRWLG